MGRNEKINLTTILGKIKSNEFADIQAFATKFGRDKIPVRVCAIRKTPEAVKETKKKIKRKESRRKFIVS